MSTWRCTNCAYTPLTAGTHHCPRCSWTVFEPVEDAPPVVASVSEFYAPPVRDLGDPATDPPLTVRVHAEPGDRHARLFDRDALRVVKAADSDDYPWCLMAGPDVGRWLTDDEVRTWPVVPALFVSSPWTLNAEQAAPAPAAQERGDMDVDAFRGEVTT